MSMLFLSRALMILFWGALLWAGDSFTVLPEEILSWTGVPNASGAFPAAGFGESVLFFMASLSVSGRRGKSARRTLPQGRGELDLFFDLSPDLCCIATAEGYFLKVNKAWENALGYTSKELISRPYLDFVHPDDFEKTREAMDKLTSGEDLTNFVNRYVCKDGTYRWLEWSASPTGDRFYAAARDITDRKEAEKALEERLEFEMLLAHLSGRFVHIPPERMDLEVDEALRRVCESFGFDIGVLWQWSGTEPRFLTITHLYRPLGGPPTPEKIDAEDLFPWSLKELAAGRIVAVSTDDAPAEAARDQELWRHYEVKSCLAFPLSSGGGPLSGVLSLNMMREKRTWSGELVKGLQLVAEMFANALARKLSDAALRESEERLSLASDSAGAGLWSLDLGTNQFWVTPKALELFGLPPEFALDFSGLLELIHHEDRGLILDAWQQALQVDTEVRIEYRINLGDGTLRWITSRGRRQLGPSGEAVRLMGVSVDITEQKQAEAAAAEIQSMITAVLESTEDMIWSVDPVRFGLLTFNSALREYFRRGLGLTLEHGMSPDDMVRGPFTSEVAAKWRAFYRRALSEGPFTEEYPVSAGSNVLLLSFSLLKRNGEVFGISVFGKDVTERKGMEERIRTGAREWQATFDSIPDMVMILDRDQNVVQANAATKSFLNLPLEGIVGSRCHQLMHGTDQFPEDCPAAALAETKRHEERDIYDGGRQRWLHVSVDPILDEQGEVVRIVHTVKDITEQKGTEAEAFAARREMMRMERLSRMGELTASLAHELNQPLAAILGNARAALRFIESGKIDMEELTEILEDIVHDDRRAGDIIRGLRAMVKAEGGEADITAPEDLIREAVTLFNSEAIIRNIRVDLDIAGPLPLVNVNRVQIEQVMINLMMNGAEAMDAEPMESRTLVIGVRESENAVVVAVRDFGKGIDASDPDKLFEPFFTTKRSGLGLGLSLSRSIIEAHGGHIGVENNRDGGATFYFDLPASPNRPA